MSIADLGSQTVVDIGILNTSGLFIGGSGTALSNYDEVNLSGNFTGPLIASTTGIFRRIGNTSIFSLNGISGVSSSGTTFQFSQNLPVPPYNNINFPIWVTNGGTTVPGNCAIDTNGHIVVSVGFNSNFNNSGTVGIPTFTVCYDTYL